MEDENFISRLIESAKVEATGKPAWGNLIKGNKIKCTGKQSIAVPDAVENEPVVVPKVDGNGVVVALEFRCTCGATTTVSLDYGHSHTFEPHG